jgi:hypothetical protein
MTGFHSFSWPNNIHIYIHTPHFPYLSTDGYLGRLHILAGMSVATMNMGVQISILISFPLNTYPAVALLSEKIVLVFLRNLHTVDSSILESYFDIVDFM